MKYRMTIHQALEAENHTVKFGFETAEQMIVAKDVAVGLLLFMKNNVGVMNA